jgi:hypothetical protein
MSRNPVLELLKMGLIIGICPTVCDIAAKSAVESRFDRRSRFENQEGPNFPSPAGRIQISGSQMFSFTSGRAGAHLVMSEHAHIFEIQKQKKQKQRATAKHPAGPVSPKSAAYDSPVGTQPKK